MMVLSHPSHRGTRMILGFGIKTGSSSSSSSTNSIGIISQSNSTSSNSSSSSCIKEAKFLL